MEVIDKPPALAGHQLHRVVAAVTRNAWLDQGDKVVIGSKREFTEGQVLAGTLRAACGVKNNGSHCYYHSNDWVSRHAWLERKGEQHGFKVLAVHCTAKRVPIDKPSGTFYIDQTDFTFVLKVIDTERFSNAAERGISSTARTYGFGLLNI